jgi:hypothetical protein
MSFSQDDNLDAAAAHVSCAAAALTLALTVHTRSFELRPAARLVAVPGDLDDPGVEKASGRIELPLHVRWSGARVINDLDDRSDRARVYEQVLREAPRTTSATTSIRRTG